jgi:hypothetical protein
MNRHLRKLFFYCLGRFFFAVGLYDKATFHYSKAIKFRFFFADIQDRYKKSIARGSKNNSFLLKGGIGDILQHLPFMLENKSFRYIVVSHFYGVNVLLKNLGIVNYETYIFNSPSEANLIIKNLHKKYSLFHCPRAIFFDKNPFQARESFRSIPAEIIIGLHVSASNLGLDKVLPNTLVNKIVDEILRREYRLMIFCTKNEQKKMFSNAIKQKRIEFVCNNEIIRSLSRVCECDFFIGSDSVFKTMSSMIKIPTLVILPIKKINTFRDRMFLDPYVKSKIMSVYTLDGKGKEQIGAAINFIFRKFITAFLK